MLNQVIMNLITNAIDAIDGAGEICISTQREKNTFCISVADTGPGIAENILDRLFEPFFTTKDVGKGTGLGLAISYQVIETHHGRIEARNNKEGGAEFIIHLPTNLAEYSHASSPAA
jgi:two-component system NtrC family sensor kinase